MSRLWTTLVRFDRWCNGKLGGDPRETISSRAGRAAQQGHLWSCRFCRFLNLFETDHCRKSLEKYNEAEP